MTSRRNRREGGDRPLTRRQAAARLSIAISALPAVIRHLDVVPAPGDHVFTLPGGKRISKAQVRLYSSNGLPDLR